MKKKVLASIVLGIGFLGGQAAFASQSNDVNHGEVNLDESRDLMSAMKLTKSTPGGGTWYHGFEKAKFIPITIIRKRLTNQVLRLEQDSMNLNGRKR